MKPLLLAAVLCPVALPAAAQDFYDADVLRTVDLAFHDANWFDLLEQNWASQTEILADLTVEGVTYPDVGVRIRGNTSFIALPPGSEKVSLNVTVDFVHPDQEVMGHSTLNFNNAFQDPTFCREVVYHEILTRWIPGGRANHVVLTLNGENWGVYANVQQYGKNVLGASFEDEDGLRVKCANNPSGPGLQYVGPDPANYAVYEIKDDGGLTDPVGAVIAVCEAVDTTPPADWPLVDQVFAIDPSIWTVVLENLFSDDDSYVNKGCDFVMYRDPLDGRMHLHQTDGNESWRDEGWQPDHQFAAGNKPFLSNVLSAPELRARYFAHLRAAIAEEFDPVELAAEFAARRDLIDAAVQADPKKLYSYQAFLDNFTETVDTGGLFGGSTIGIAEYVADRRALLLADPEVAAVGPTIGAVSASTDVPGLPVFVTAAVSGPDPLAAVDLFLRPSPTVPFQSLAMADDGLSGDGAAGDGVFGVQLPFTGSVGQKVEYYVRATAQNAFGAQTFQPVRTELDPLVVVFQGVVSSDVVINEFVARNNSGIQDPSGSFEDWVELYNKGAVTIDLSGLHLSDSVTLPPSWQLPAGTTLAPGETLLVWADEDLAEGPLHADFKLSAEGEEVALWAADGSTLLDAVVFGPQAIDVSTGRLADGGTPLVTFPAPTPDELNDGACGLRAYDQLDPAAHLLDLASFGTGSIGTNVVVTGVGFQPTSLTTFAVAFAPAHLALPQLGLVALVGGAVSTVALPSDGAGLVPVPLTVPAEPLLVGVKVYFQLAGASASGPVSATNAVELAICP